ncbi:MAG: hypothetical protein RIC55_18095 [Pirellulaceae bacterium]
MDEKTSPPPRHGRFSLRALFAGLLVFCAGAALIRLGLVLGEGLGLFAVLAGVVLIVGTIQFLLTALVPVR